MSCVNTHLMCIDIESVTAGVPAYPKRSRCENVSHNISLESVVILFFLGGHRIGHGAHGHTGADLFSVCVEGKNIPTHPPTYTSSHPHILPPTHLFPPPTPLQERDWDVLTHVVQQLQGLLENRTLTLAGMPDLSTLCVELCQLVSLLVAKQHDTHNKPNTIRWTSSEALPLEGRQQHRRAGVQRWEPVFIQCWEVYAHTQVT